MAKLNLDLTLDIPEGFTPLEAVVVIKCLDEDGELALSVRTTSGLTSWESVGMLIAASDQARSQINQDFKDAEET